MNMTRIKSSTRQRNALAVVFFVVGIHLCGVALAAAPVVLKEMPANGTLPFGQVAYVDDGKCPPGEVKKLTGGNQKTSIARKVECVKRPEGS